MRREVLTFRKSPVQSKPATSCAQLSRQQERLVSGNRAAGPDSEIFDANLQALLFASTCVSSVSVLDLVHRSVTVLHT
jgi:hypothetical protein